MQKFILFILLVPIFLFGQYNGAAFNIGYFNPSATDGGLVLGYKGEKFVDNNLSWGWSTSWFHVKYIDQVLLREVKDYYNIIDGSIIENKATTNVHSIPIMGVITAYFPMLPSVNLFVAGNLGIEGLIISYNNLENDNESDIKTAWDFAWEVGTGLSYRLGRRSNFYGELSYHNSNPSWHFEVTDQITRRTKSLEQSFDMSGVALKIGFKFLW